MTTTPNPETSTTAAVTVSHSGKTRAEHLNDSYQHAQGTLREKYTKEFNDLRLAYLKDRGITDWSPAPTDQEKAAAQIATLLRQFPDLAEQFRQETLP